MNQQTSIDIQELSPAELASGIRSERDKYVCVVCGSEFLEGVIYTVDETQMTAELACRRHIEGEHGGMLAVLLGLPSAVTGLTDVQAAFIESMATGLTDKQIAQRMGDKATSTVRNHRYQYRRRLSEAKVLVAIGSLLEERVEVDRYVQYHPGIPVHDDRIVTSRSEAAGILDRLLEPGDKLVLSRMPRKEKEKLVVLQRISKEFEVGREYTEREVNEMLASIYSDYVAIRRYLVDYRFLSRTLDGRVYWVPTEG